MTASSTSICRQASRFAHIGLLGAGLNSNARSRPSPSTLNRGRQDARELVSQAVTFGPMFSAEISELVGATTDLAEITGLVAAAVARGFDISTWLEARALITVFGPMAEAVARRKSFHDVWESYESEADVRSLVRDGVIGGPRPTSAPSIGALLCGTLPKVILSGGRVMRAKAMRGDSCCAVAFAIGMIVLGDAGLGASHSEVARGRRQRRGSQDAQERLDSRFRWRVDVRNKYDLCRRIGAGSR
jgi:hypothetical protein